MKKQYALAIFCIFLLLTSSVGVYALSLKQETKTEFKDKIEPVLDDGVFIANIGLEKNKESLYNLNGNWQWDKKILNCEGTVNTGEKEGLFTGTFKLDKKSYFEIIIIIEEEKLVFSGEYKTGKNKEEFHGMWSQGGKEECFEFVYPISYIMPDGSTIITGESEKELWQLINEWYKANPEEKEKPVLQYPVDIKYKDGTVVTIYNDEELKNAYEECSDDKLWGWIEGIFQGFKNSKPKNKPNNLIRFPLLARLLKMSIFSKILKLS
jgi:hypothetical protein